MRGNLTRTIRVAPGIGDNIWLLQKLINAGERFNFQLNDSHPQRGKQIFDLLPQVAASCEYVPRLHWKHLLRSNIQKSRREWKAIKDLAFSLTMNEHLEEGYRIETFFPDLETSFRIDWATTEEDKARAQAVCGEESIFKPVGIYASAYSTSRNWGFWDENGWLELIKSIHEGDPNTYFIIIGAEWDTDLGKNLMGLLDKEEIPYVNTIGDSLGAVIEIMKRLHYFYAFPSGLGILAPTVDCPVTMFYPPHLEKMINAWAAPGDIESGLYHGTLFCTPEEAYKWASDKKFI